MIKLFQQTTLTMPELLAFLKKGKDLYPRCLLISEISAACQSGNDTPEGEGEKYLISLLSRRSKQERTIAYCTLSCLEGKNEEILADFRNQSRNRKLMRAINRMLKD